MTINNSYLNFKKVLIVLTILLLCSIFFNFKTLSASKTITIKTLKAVSEKNKIMHRLHALESKYTLAIADKSSLSNELLIERSKVSVIIKELADAEESIIKLQNFKNKYIALNLKLEKIQAEHKKITAQNKLLKMQYDSSEYAVRISSRVNKLLSEKNNELSGKVLKAQKLLLFNLKTIALKVKNSGYQIDTQKANQTDIIKISFSIAENNLASPSLITYYVQVLDSNNNVLGEKKTENYGSKKLTYSFEKTIVYENKSVEITENLTVKDLNVGLFYVTIFENGQVVGKTHFELK